MTNLSAAWLALATVAVAQAPPPVMLHLTVAGPAAWRARLGPTNVGTMLATSQAEAIWRGQIDKVDRALRPAHERAAGGAAARPRFFDYAGEVQLVVWLEQAEDALHLRRWSAAMIVGSDGRTDLATMVAEGDEWLARTGAAAVPRWLEMQVQPPVQHDRRIVVTMACAEDDAAVAARAVAFTGRPLGDAVLRLDLEVPTVLGTLRDRPSEREFVAALLGPGTQRATLEVGHVGPQVAIDLCVTFGGDGRGVLSGLLPAARETPHLLRFVPDDTATHYAWRIDAPEFWKRAIDAAAIAADMEPKVLHERLSKQCGVDVAKQVMALLSAEALLLWRAAGEHDDASGLFANLCLVVPVSDEAALIEAARTALTGAGKRPVLDDGGVLRCDTVFASLAIGHGIACVAFGTRGAAHRDAVIEHAAAGRRPDAPAVPSQGAPKGCNGRGRIDVATLFERDLHLRWLPIAITDRGNVARIAGEATRWLPLLREHGLADASTLGGVTTDAWRLRILW